MISTSILSIKDNIEENIQKLDNTKTTFMHIDVMDGIFVSNNSVSFDVYESLLKDVKTPLDVHLMVQDVKKYIDLYKGINPVIITFHYEAVTNHIEIIEYIKSFNIKAGMAIKPDTKIEEIEDILPYLDMVLVMSVEPGRGHQEFIYDSPVKINALDKIRKEKNYAYLIEVDGGVNDITAKLCNNADIIVVGSFITDSDYYESQIEKIKKTLDYKNNLIYTI